MGRGEGLWYLKLIKIVDLDTFFNFILTRHKFTVHDTEEILQRKSEAGTSVGGGAKGRTESRLARVNPPNMGFD
jgi:hypothetical protein